MGELMGSKLVLVVEDNEDDREIYGKILWYNGFDVIAGIDGEMGYWLAREARPDLILLDLGLPDMDGMAMCRRLQADEATAGIPMIVLSARAEQSFGEQARALGCVGYIEKPARPLDVLRQVENIIGRAESPKVELRMASRAPGRFAPTPIRLPTAVPHPTTSPSAACESGGDQGGGPD